MIENMEFHIGDKVRNIRSGNIGQIIEMRKGCGHTGPFSFVRILVVKEPSTKYTTYWERKNMELL